MPKYQPSFARVDPVTGVVTGLFPGGVEMLAADSTTPASSRSVRWVRDTGGGLVAQAFGYESANMNALYLKALKEAGARWTRVLMYADGDTDGEAYVDALVDNAAPNSVSASAVDGAGVGQTRLIIDEDGTSGFLKLRFTSGMELAFGRTSFTFVAGSQFFDATITHNLGTTPTIGNAITNWVADILAPTWIEIRSWNSTTATWRVGFGGALGANVNKNLYWFVIG